MQELQYYRPRSLDEALDLLSTYGREAKVLAGGTDLIIALKDNLISCRHLVDIKAIEEMRGISFDEETGLSIGGAVSLNEIIDNEIIKNHCQYTVLITAAKTLANSLLRNRATMMGNICNASPAGDMLPPALVLQGSVELVSCTGRRMVPLKEFFTGVKRTVIKPEEMAVRIVFPNIRGKGAYLRKSRIKGHDLSQIGVAGFSGEDGKLFIAAGAAAPVPVLVEFEQIFKKENLIYEKENIVSKVMENINPIGDQRASKEYRLAMAKYLTGQVVEELAKEV